jgi:hypothetical protein
MSNETVRRLSELSELHARGAMTDEELARARARLLGGPSLAAPGVERRPPGDPSAAAAPRARPSRVAASAALLGGVLTLVAFVVLPLVTVPDGLLTDLLELAGVAGRSFTGAELATMTSNEPMLALLWLVPAVAAAVVAIATRQLVARRRPARRRGAQAVLGLAGALALAHLAALLVGQRRIPVVVVRSLEIGVLDLAAAGFWVGFGGMVAAAVAAAVTLLRPP